LTENQGGTDDQYFREIGRFIALFSAIEALLKIGVCDFAKIASEDQTRIMTHDFAMTCTMAEGVIASRLKESDAAAFRDLIKRCRRLNEHRVRIVHGFWVMGEGAELYHISRQKLELQPFYDSAAKIVDAADEASNLRDDLWAILDKFEKRPASSAAR
jgi:hypothetical protein